MMGSDEPDQVGVDADGVTWIRSGSCCRCGECCMSGNPFETGENTEIPGACPLLIRDGEVFACGDRQHPYYLSGCAHWPSIPQHIADYPSCSYVFRRAE